MCLVEAGLAIEERRARVLGALRARLRAENMLCGVEEDLGDVGGGKLCEKALCVAQELKYA